MTLKSRAYRVSRGKIEDLPAEISSGRMVAPAGGYAILLKTEALVY
jgi:hypothetical protein